MSRKILEYAKLLTFHQWGVSCLTGVYGALSAGEFDFLPLFLLALTGVCFTVYGAVLNDYVDVDVDKMSKDLQDRPLVKGSILRKNALYISISAPVIAYLIFFIGMYLDVFIFDIFSLMVITLGVFFGAVYNFFGKKIIGSDIFVAFASSFFCLFGAMLVSNTISNLTIVIVCLVFLQIFYMNSVIGGLKDADHDYKMKTKNIAYAMGVKINKKVIIPISFKIFGLLFRISSAIILFLPVLFFRDFPYLIWQPVLMLVMLIAIFYITIKMLTIKKFDRNQFRKLISAQTFLRYAIVPVMLLSFIGIRFFLFLIIFPILWYAIFNKIIYGNLFQPKRM